MNSYKAETLVSLLLGVAISSLIMSALLVLVSIVHRQRQSVMQVNESLMKVQTIYTFMHQDIRFAGYRGFQTYYPGRIAIASRPGLDLFSTRLPILDTLKVSRHALDGDFTTKADARSGFSALEINWVPLRYFQQTAQFLKVDDIILLSQPSWGTLASVSRVSQGRCHFDLSDNRYYPMIDENRSLEIIPAAQVRYEVRAIRSKYRFSQSNTYALYRQQRIANQNGWRQYSQELVRGIDEFTVINRRGRVEVVVKLSGICYAFQIECLHEKTTYSNSMSKKH
jgi:hypothetical protein